MQKLSITFLSLMVVFLTSACTDFLTDVDPGQSLPSETAFGTSGGLDAALIGAYNSLQASDYGATGLALNSNIQSDNGEWRGSFPSYIDMFNRRQTVNNGEVLGLWTNAYRVINQTNLILDNIDAINEASFTEDVENVLRGEAQFLRGMAYFELARAFGQPYGATSGTDLAVPIVLTGVLVAEDITFPARNTVEEVYNQAISDLEAARELLPFNNSPGRASGAAAVAYLADIAFQKREYEDAATLAKLIIDGGFALVSDPDVPFTDEGSPEEIFAVVNTTQDNPGVNGSLATFHHLNGRGGDVVVSSDLLANGYQAVITAEQQAAAGVDSVIDLRFSLLTSGGGANPNIEKYEDFANNADDNIISRLATYILMRAEALVRTDGINAESIMLLNQIRNRSLRLQDANGFTADASEVVSYEAEDFADADALIDAIVLERRVELAFEGNRLNDLRRLMRDIRDLPFDDPRLVFPIPQREIDANANLDQNPGY